MAILPACLNERAANVDVARLGDLAATRRLTARIEGGHEAQVRSERARGFEALDAMELSDEDHRDRRIDAAEQRSHATCSRYRGSCAAFAVSLSIACRRRSACSTASVYSVTTARSTSLSKTSDWSQPRWALPHSRLVVLNT